MGLFDGLPTKESLDQPVNTPAAPAVETPAAVVEPPAAAAPPAQSQTPNSTPAAPESAAQPAATTAPAVDYNAYIDTMSGGVIKDEEAFKAVLPKITEYDTLKQQHEELAAKMAKAPVFADDEVRILNELKAAGASKEQIKTFQKINEYGTISELPDRDARIARMVMIDGVKPSVAELKVDREFKLNDEDLSEEEREILNDDLRVAANNDRKELEKFKAAASQAGTSPEEALLQQQALITAHQSTVKPYVKDVMASVPNLGVYTLSGKEGAADAVKFEIPLDDATRATLGQYVENYFMDGLTPPTPENTRLALHYARAEYFRENSERIFRDIYEQATTAAEERMIAKYENRSGLKPQSDKPLIPGTNAEQETANFMQKVANRTVNR